MPPNPPIPPTPTHPHLWRAILIALIVVLVVGTTIPGSLKANIEGQMWQGWPWSTSAHFLLFACIAALPVYGQGPGAVFRALSLALLLALVTEGLQAWAPGRHPLLRDVLIDLAGTIFGMGCRHFMRGLVR
jgi:hypothetical protein